MLVAICANGIHRREGIEAIRAESNVCIDWVSIILINNKAK